MSIDQKKIEEWKAQIEVLDGLTRYLGPLVELREFLPALLAEREEMLALLREVEWRGNRPPYGESCPLCGRFQDDHAPNAMDESDPYARTVPGGHSPDCRLSRAIREET